MQNKNININIPLDVQLILDRLHDNNYKAYVVGGCVRDSVLGLEPKDWDITTNAKPTNVIDMFKDFSVIPTGLKHGTVTIMINNIGYEITTFRVYGEYEDNRHSKTVTFTNELKADLSRRDFTINAMAYNNREGLIDYFGGLKDIGNKLIRCVGNSTDRFNEDALRMLRAIRFSAKLGFYTNFDIDNSINELASNINKISKERIREELNKIIMSNPEKIIDLCENELMYYIFEGISKMYKFKQNNPYHSYNLLGHTINSMNVIEKRLELRLAMLLHDTGKVNTQTTDDNGICHYKGHAKESKRIAQEFLKEYKYDNSTIDKVIILIENHDYIFSEDEYTIKKQIKRLLNKIGEENLKDLILVRQADIMAQNPIYAIERLKKTFLIENILNEVLNEHECFSVKNLNINGNDLINLGFKQGKEIGTILNKLLDAVIEEKVENDFEALKHYIISN